MRRITTQVVLELRKKGISFLTDFYSLAAMKETRKEKNRKVPIPVGRTFKVGPFLVYCSQRHGKQRRRERRVNLSNPLSEDDETKRTRSPLLPCFRSLFAYLPSFALRFLLLAPGDYKHKERTEERREGVANPPPPSPLLSSSVPATRRKAPFSPLAFFSSFLTFCLRADALLLLDRLLLLQVALGPL